MKVIVLLSFINIAFAHTMKIYRGGPLEIITIGHPTLTMIADEVHHDDIKTPKMQKFIEDMFKTMKNAGGVGLAAPQVNVSKRLFVMKPSFFTKAQAVINPTIDYNSAAGTKNSSEGCLSIPGKTFKVKRYKDINVTYFNRHGEYQAENLTGFKAIVFQHEYDHLNGILISDFFTEYIYATELETPLL
jgi:peptide deformylase